MRTMVKVVVVGRVESVGLGGSPSAQGSGLPGVTNLSNGRQGCDPLEAGGGHSYSKGASCSQPASTV